VVDCSIDDGVLFDTHTGEVINDDVATVLWRTTVVRGDDAWKVSFNSIEQEWEGIAGCALE
jgi:hypothetical protein